MPTSDNLKKTYVVTGAAGFIGSHLCEHLVARGADVIGIDNFSTGSKTNLAGLLDSKCFTLVEDSVNTSSLDHMSVPDGVSFVHLAAIADVVPSVSNPIEYMDINVQGTVTALELARRVRASHFVYAASSSCYGIPDEYPTSENCEIRPMYPYAFSKWAGELTAMHWSQVYGIPVASLRFFNVIGPRVRAGSTYGAVLGVFAGQKMAGLPLTIVGDGAQMRDFLDVRDLAAAIEAATREEIEGIFNVASGAPRSVLELATLISDNWEFIPDRPGEPKKTHGDASKFRSRVKWSPVHNLESTVDFAFSDPLSWSETHAWRSDEIAESTKEWFRYLA